MNFSQQLYSEYLERRRSQASSKDPHSIRRRNILRAFLDLPDQRLVTLESSISLLRRLSLIKCLQSVEDIVGIMQRKRRSCGEWGSEQELNQCRLIYFIWAVVEQEHLEMREFKQLVLTLAQEQGRTQAIRSAYGQKEGIQELLQSWDSLMLSAMEDRDPQQSISNLSIIKSKNEGNYDSNKQNVSYFQEEEVSTTRNHIKRTSHLQNTNSSNSLEKSFQRRESRGKLNNSRSTGKIAGRKSETNTIPPSSGIKPCSFVSESLSVAEEKNLVARLYRYEQYRQRQELKKQTQEQRMRAELQRCSFKPRIDRGRAISRGKGEVRGYEKAVNRMKSGYKKNKQLRQNLEYRIWTNKPTTNISDTRISAPKFLSRVKDAAVELFQIVFTIGRHSIRVKIRQSDKISDIVDNIGQIYSLKEDSREYIRGIVEQELNNYYQAKLREENEGEMQNFSNQ